MQMHDHCLEKKYLSIKNLKMSFLFKSKNFRHLVAEKEFSKMLFLNIGIFSYDSST